MLLLIQSLYPLQFGARDLDCVLAELTGIRADGNLFLSSGYGAASERRHMEAGHRRLDYIIFTGDEKVTILPHKRDLEVPDNPDTDIRERPDMSDTQREDWLLQMEPLHGARPMERPPVINDRSGGLDLEAAGVWGGGGGRKMNPNGIRAPLLPLERHILLEGEVTTPPGGGGGGASGPRASGFTTEGGPPGP